MLNSVMPSEARNLARVTKDQGEIPRFARHDSLGAQ